VQTLRRRDFRSGLLWTQESGLDRLKLGFAITLDFLRVGSFKFFGVVDHGPDAPGCGSESHCGNDVEKIFWPRVKTEANMERKSIAGPMRGARGDEGLVVRGLIFENPRQRVLWPKFRRMRHL
jgi:hypothetical protein